MNEVRVRIHPRPPAPGCPGQRCGRSAPWSTGPPQAGSGRCISASLAGSTTAAMAVIQPSTTVKASTESGVPSSRQEITPGRPSTSAARPRVAAPAASCAPAATRSRSPTSSAGSTARSGSRPVGPGEPGGAASARAVPGSKGCCPADRHARSPSSRRRIPLRPTVIRWSRAGRRLCGVSCGSCRIGRGVGVRASQGGGGRHCGALATDDNAARCVPRRRGPGRDPQDTP